MKILVILLALIPMSSWAGCKDNPDDGTVYCSYQTSDTTFVASKTVFSPQSAQVPLNCGKGYSIVKSKCNTTAMEDYVIQLTQIKNEDGLMNAVCNFTTAKKQYSYWDFVTVVECRKD